MKLNFLVILFGLAGCFFAWGQAPQEPRNWTSKDGRMVEGVLIDSTPYDVKLRLAANRKDVVVALDDLSFADREFVSAYPELRKYRPSKFAPKLRVSSRLQAITQGASRHTILVSVVSLDQREIDNLEVLMAFVAEPQGDFKGASDAELRIYAGLQKKVSLEPLGSQSIESPSAGNRADTSRFLGRTGLVVQVWQGDILIESYASKGSLADFAARPTNRGGLGGSKPSGIALKGPPKESRGLGTSAPGGAGL